jgi:peptidoglycan/LPS O-acetylase OafA/YrhL
MACGAALLWDFRLRIALALLVALGLGVTRWRLGHDAHHQRPGRKSIGLRLLRLLSRSSYALFLTHFSIVLLANVLWARMGWTFAGAAAWVTAGAWVICIAVSLLFERLVERPLSAIRIPV